MLVLIINPIEKVMSFEPESFCKKVKKSIVCEIYECRGLSNKYCSNDLRHCGFLLSYQKLMKGYRKKDWKQVFMRNIPKCDSYGRVDFKNQCAHRFYFG